MGRAPNSGAPQRVSAHVVPKALSPFSEEEDEKTTIESGWEEEASTTVEQGEVAEKIRQLGLDAPRGRNTGTNVTSTNANSTIVDEPTVDDQRANAALSLITPQAVLSRLVITQGNDSGQELEILPGKSYTIGRAIDNDVVLTDIAVSRKHFDLRHEDGSWVVVDRGSGNGTVVNGNVEDQPFMLANGDTIEIGNTSFRFDHPNGFARPQAATYDVDLDEEEPSTVAGKPIRDDIATPAQMPSPLRAKTIPPPAPLPRPRPVSSAPPMKAAPMGMAYPSASNGHNAALPASLQPTMSPHQGIQAPHHSPHQGMSPLQHAQPLQQLQRAALGSNQPTILGNHMDGMQNVMPTTIPGQGPPVHPSQPQLQAYAYPSASEQHAKMLVITNQPGRDATSTALVQPTPYGNGMQPMMVPQQQAYVSPQISRRTKLLLGGAGLSLLAAIATIAIIKGASGSEKSDNAVGPGSDGSAGQPTKPVVTKPVIESIEIKPDPKRPTIDPKKTEPPKVDPKKTEPPKVDPKLAITEPPKVDPKKTTKRDPKKDRTPVTPVVKRVATGGDIDVYKVKADGLYRQKKFNDAAGTLRSAAGSFSGADSTALLSLAGTYEQFGRKYNLGMAGTTSPAAAWEYLKTALSFDIGGAYKEEIQTKLQQISTKAALTFIGAKNYNRAVEAVRLAEQTGGPSGSTKIVRDGLESYAGELYTAAAKEIDSNPEAARSKLKQIKGLVETKSPWYQKATKLLSGSN